MKHIRIVDQVGNHTEHQTEFVPRIGEVIVLEYGPVGRPKEAHYFRVKDVMYRLDHKPENQRLFLVEEVVQVNWDSK
jgi:hypothetical protein